MPEKGIIYWNLQWAVFLGWQSQIYRNQKATSLLMKTLADIYGHTAEEEGI